jgi:CHAT domain-containing protein
MGLQRAFQAAGARSLIASLWSVEDHATAALMDEFYANLWARGIHRLEALRQAQLTLLRRFDPRRLRLVGPEELSSQGKPVNLSAAARCRGSDPSGSGFQPAL